MEEQLYMRDKKALLKIAKMAITNQSSIVRVDFSINKESYLNKKCGVFVSVYVQGVLRGCLGRFKSNKPLYELVAIMAFQAAFHDSRFEPITVSEVNEMEIELSVISPFKEITSIDEFELGKHGIYIKQGLSSGTFLPQVAKKTGWNTEEFLGHCARDKAGIGWDGWKKADLFIYTAAVFRDKAKGV